jgi:hypothetical protein
LDPTVATVSSPVQEVGAPTVFGGVEELTLTVGLVPPASRMISTLPPSAHSREKVQAGVRVDGQVTVPPDTSAMETWDGTEVPMKKKT